MARPSIDAAGLKNWRMEAKKCPVRVLPPGWLRHNVAGCLQTGTNLTWCWPMQWPLEYFTALIETSLSLAVISKHPSAQHSVNFTMSVESLAHVRWKKSAVGFSACYLCLVKEAAFWSHTYHIRLFVYEMYFFFPNRALFCSVRIGLLMWP